MYLSASQIELIRKYFSDKKSIKRAYLFGSYSRGEANETSDIDILLDLDYTTAKGLDFIGWRLDLMEQLNKPVEFVTEKFISPLLESQIHEDKKLIYAQ
jgi:uncharacterized protein